jgi:predicted N-acyltransferase
MMTPRKAIVKVVGSLAAIRAEEWDACANPTGKPYHPFVAHSFLKALEDSGCIGPRTGWTARHLVLENELGEISGIAPAYVKTHSQGEYVFDHSWADAYARAGGRYYPKFQIAVPFTPVPGPRLLVKPGATAHADEELLAAAAVEVVQQNGLSSVHITFESAEVQDRLTALGYLARTGQQFHWLNRGYETFDDFLATLASRKRKAVRKERVEALSAGIEIEHVSGLSITEAHWDAMFGFYMDTGNRKWGRPYLNREFFSRLGAAMADHCLLILAKRDGRYIAGALNMIGGDCLYGRYWGTTEHHPGLHFEVCYYQAIDYAIAHGLRRVEAGAQGDHKLARGYLPVKTYSSHWIANPSLRDAIARYLAHERETIEEINVELEELGPYRKS